MLCHPLCTEALVRERMVEHDARLFGGGDHTEAVLGIRAVAAVTVNFDPHALVDRRQGVPLMGSKAGLLAPTLTADHRNVVIGHPEVVGLDEDGPLLTRLTVDDLPDRDPAALTT